MKNDDDSNLNSLISIKKIIDFLPNPMLISKVKDQVHQPIYLNEKFKEVIGYSLEEIPNIDEWFRRAYTDEQYRIDIFSLWIRERDKAKKKGIDYGSLKAKIHCKDGSDKWFMVKASFWGKEVEVVVFSNIDEIERKNQELDQLNKLKDKILSVVSHDIREPLASLSGLLKLLDSSAISEKEIKDLIPMVSRQLHNVSSLLDTLLNWAKSQIRKNSPDPELFDLQEILSFNISLLKTEADRKGIIIEEAYDKGILVFADNKMIGSVIRNLIANAIKFTPKKGKILIFSTLETGFAVVKVKDNGVGMSEEKQENFIKKESFTTRGTDNEKGTGLGLLLCQEFIALNGGEMWIKSKIDHGTEFSFSIPIQKNPKKQYI